MFYSSVTTQKHPDYPTHLPYIHVEELARSHRTGKMPKQPRAVVQQAGALPPHPLASLFLLVEVYVGNFTGK
jgi:hypothetical protein